MIPLLSGSPLAKRLRLLAASLGYRIELEYRALANSPENILRVEPSWLLAKLAELEHGCSFIQIGANDGIRCDPIRSYVLRHGWRGVLVEPDPWYFTQLIQNYDETAGLHFLNAAIGDGTEAEFYSVAKDAPNYPDWAFGIGSLDRHSILRHAHLLPDLDRYVESIKVKIFSINHIAATYFDGNIDLLVVDVEGHDADIIQSINVSQWKPRAIFYESVHLDRERHQQLLAWLVANGYYVHVGGQDSFAILPGLMN